MKRAVLSLSGGMDSTSLLIHLLANGYQVRCFSFDYGQRHKIELDAVKETMNNLINHFGESEVVSYSIINLVNVFCDSKSALTSDTKVPEGHYAEESMKKTVVENRNAIFASIIYSKALSWANEVKDNVEICLGIHAGDHQLYPDCRPEFRNALNHAFEIGNWNSERVKFYTPYIHSNKTGILKDLAASCIKLDMNFIEVLYNTNTCYNPNHGAACGRCGSCIERVEAFINNEITDPILYADTWENTVDHAKFILNK